MLKVLVLIAAFCGVYVECACQIPLNDQCDVEILDCCDKLFQGAIGISPEQCQGQPTYLHPDCINARWSTLMYSNGTEGVLESCDAFNDFRHCLGRTARTCTSYEFFLRKKGLSTELAHNIDGHYSMMEFQCGAGLESYLLNADDYEHLIHDHSWEIFRLNNNYRDCVKSPPIDECECLIEFTSSVQRLFIYDAPELAWWMCETAHAYGTAAASYCGVKCCKSANNCSHYF